MSLSAITRRTRLIYDKEISAHYDNFTAKDVGLDHYLKTWKQWLSATNNKSIAGLDSFSYGVYSSGSAQCFDHFYLDYADKIPVAFVGDFQYHQCAARKKNFVTLHNVKDLQHGQCLIISLPFSDYGRQHPDFDEIMHRCRMLNIPVCLDIAYWGISKNVNLDLDRYPAVVQIVSSLSKPFHSLETHRVGVRFSRNYNNDGLDMINEVGLANTHSMALGCWFMDHYCCDWLWNKYHQSYYDVCELHTLTPTDTVIFALGDQQRFGEHNRGIPGNFRVCISSLLTQGQT